MNEDWDCIKYTGDKAFENLEEAEHLIKNYGHYQKYGFGRWTVLDKISGEFLGWCGLKYDQNLDETDIGFRFFEEHWNKGLATESAKACINFGFENLNLKSIVGRAMSENIASIKVLEKIGLKFEREFDFDKSNKGVIYRINK
jgi:RimJ/RimL family protein N-acetyltransferase